jgi:hypothetical protein
MHTFRYRLNSPIDDVSLLALESVLASLLAGSGAKAAVNQESQLLCIRVSWHPATLPTHDFRERFLTDVCWDALQCAFDLSRELWEDRLSPEEVAYRDAHKARCHSCGSYTAGTRHGHFVLDNQPPLALEETGTPRSFYRHCQNCACRQAQELWEVLLAGSTVVAGQQQITNARAIEFGGSNDFGLCECCGGCSRTIWGFLHRDTGENEAEYFVQWTVGKVNEHGANFDLIIGGWGEGTTKSDRCAVALALRWINREPQFMVIDAATRPVAHSDLVGRTLAREDVIGTPIAQLAFDIIDDIWLYDPRIKEIVSDR